MMNLLSKFTAAIIFLLTVYDSEKTNQQEIVKRIALAGYDSDQFLAPGDVYAKLPECCQYERMNSHSKQHSSGKTVSTLETKQDIQQLKPVFENYFELKDALVKSDGKMASSIAKKLQTTIKSVQMSELSAEEHLVWMKVMKGLAFDAKHIEETKDAEHQRDHFITLSNNMYLLLKVSKQETPTYYQHCPMANKGKGANWLSKENTIKNPYYGSQMLNCGKTVETIK
ncbi:MAG: DUF3347 domain-containing protein [bacterium]|nr:DUF3347 domain-containing protein [bacterium]